jgi:hypothetical protein
LVDYTKISPNSNCPRTSQIKKITLHHMAGNLSVETCGSLFAASSRQASSNYSVGTDGRVGMYVEEKNRAWTSSSAGNDQQAVTIEVANDGGDPDWHVSDKAIAATIDLCTDICKRNSIPQLVYTGDASGNVTHHYMFIATACPGPYLKSKTPYIVGEVNKRLGAASTQTTAATATTPATDTAKPAATATPAAAKPAASTAKPAPAPTAFTPYLARVTTAALNIRKGAGTNCAVTGVITDRGAYTIVEEAKGSGAAKWGRLKSGAGWISLDYTQKI